MESRNTVGIKGNNRLWRINERKDQSLCVLDLVSLKEFRGRKKNLGDTLHVRYMKDKDKPGV